MTRARPFPLDNAAEAARGDEAAPPASTLDRTWPVLARIGEVRRGEKPAAQHAERPLPGPTPRRYRVDAAHRATVRDTEPRDTQFAVLPGALRLAVEGWRLLDAYRPLVRAAAMLVLMALAGMSMSVMMNPQPTPKRAATETASAATSAAEAAEAIPAIPPPVIEPILTPDAPTTSASPTAVGPLGRSVPESEKADAAELEPIAAAYPVTPYAELPLPVPQAELPTVRTDDPPLGIARLQGEIREVPIR